MQVATGAIDFNWWSSILTEYVVHPFIITILCLLSVFVVLGNLLVVSAIWHENQLHSVTNYLIASLAAADCLVGAVVMPFSIMSEIIIGHWPFGATWCDLWHSFDVLASTASIMNLCAISLDRYLAITDPISYPRRMTTKRVALLIFSLWTCSSLISFPAIIWWRAVGQGSLQKITVDELPATSKISTSHDSNQSDILSTEKLELRNHSSFPIMSDYEQQEQFKCVFTDDTYYLLFSSFISFYGPLCIMLYAYYRIYRAAVQQTRFLKYGSKQVMISKRSKKRSKHSSEQSACTSERMGADASCEGGSTLDAYDRQHLVLRAHRGGAGATGSGITSNRPGNHEALPHDKKGPSDEPTHRSSERSRLPGTSIGGERRFNSERLAKSERDRPNRTLPHERVSGFTSKRDKLRMDRQRFDTCPIGASSKSAAEAGPSKLVDYGTYNKPGLGHDDKGDSCSNDHKDKNNQLSRQRFRRQEERSTAPLSPQCKSLDSSTGNTRTRELRLSEEKDETVGLAPKHSEVTNKCKDSEVPDDCESASVTSDDSYGTGSIASVLMKPQKNHPNIDSKFSTKHSCDTDLSEFDNHKLKRASSYGDTRQICRKPICETKEQKSLPVPKRLRDLRSISQASSMYARSIDIVEGRPSGTKHLSLRTKFIRPRAKKSESSHVPKQIKPPPSLLPLMMMNSDTSTDSSINASFTSKNERKNRRASEVSPSDAGQTAKVLLGIMRRSSQGPSRSSSPPSSPRNRDLHRCRPCKSSATSGSHESESSSARKGGSEKTDSQGKGQMIHYNSDRLIQSIVDLSEIHYIDCVNQETKSPERIEINEKAAVTNEDNSKRNSPIADRVHIVDLERNVSRSNKSVGKKLSKLAKERKAAKTLGIVVGVFILCWLPFFVNNIMVAFCGSNCIFNLQLFVTIITWLGWLNSAMNPVIYACWSRDFRRAFRRVLCSWVEFICPYETLDLAKRLKLKKCPSYQEAYSNRNMSSIKGINSSSVTMRNGISSVERGAASMNGDAQNLLSDQ